MNAPEILTTKQARFESYRTQQRKLVQHVGNGRTTDMAAAPLRVSKAIFTDPARLDAEKKELFAKLPLVAGLSAEIPQAGDTLLFDGNGVSIIVIRDKDGYANAFLNICTHRASQLLKECGRVDHISCPFHGWTFDLQGSLVAQPGSEGFSGIERKELGLIRVPCAELHGLIFIRATSDGTSRKDFESEAAAFLGNFGYELSLLELDTYAPGKSGMLEAKANWKYMAETFAEGYHFAALHPNSVGEMLYTNVAACQTFGRHHRICYAPKSYQELVGKPESEWPEVDAFVYSIFPNTQLLVGIPRTEPGPDTLQLHRIYPDTTSTARSHYTIYVKADFMATDGGREYAAMVYDLGSHIVGTEDFAIAAAAQRMLNAAPDDFKVTYGRNEILIQHYQRNLAEAIGKPI